MLDRIKILFGNTESFIKKKLIKLILLNFILLPVIYYIAIYLILGHVPSISEFIIISIMVIMVIITYFILKLTLFKQFDEEKLKIIEELDFFNLIIGNTDELILLLNGFGEIINCNPPVFDILDFEPDKIKGSPFRMLFNLEEMDDKYKLMILEKLKEAFQGKVTELISPIKIKSEKDFQSIYFKLTPNYKNKNLESIFVYGRLLKSDFITNNWLDSETSKYTISNDLTLSNILCYRLTRNLDGKLPRNSVLLIQVAIQEVLVNAIEHGNLEINFDKKTELKRRKENYFELLITESNKNYIKERKVEIHYSLSRDNVIYTIIDDGEGFDWKKYMDEEYFNTNADQFISTFHGVGLQMVKSAFDEVNHNEKGNEITLVKYFKK